MGQKAPTRYNLADRCHEVGSGFPHGHEVRELLLECRRRMLLDGEEIGALKSRLDAVRKAIDFTQAPDGFDEE